MKCLGSLCDEEDLCSFCISITCLVLKCILKHIEKTSHLQSGDVASQQQNDVIHQEIQQGFLQIPVLGAPTDIFNSSAIPETLEFISSLCLEHTAKKSADLMIETN